LNSAASTKSQRLGVRRPRRSILGHPGVLREEPEPQIRKRINDESYDYDPGTQAEEEYETGQRPHTQHPSGNPYPYGTTDPRWNGSASVAPPTGGPSPYVTYPNDPYNYYTMNGQGRMPPTAAGRGPTPAYYRPY